MGPLRVRVGPLEIYVRGKTNPKQTEKIPYTPIKNTTRFHPKTSKREVLLQHREGGG
jgi:hypothetical protein